MNVLVTSHKGGTGKSSIAYNLSIFAKSRYVTNDLTITEDPDIIQIDTNLKRIPVKHRYPDNTVYDFGAMSTNIDPKIIQAIHFSDVIVIPTLTDQRSLLGTVATYGLVKSSGKPIVIILNNFTDHKKATTAEEFLISQIGSVKILRIRSTTLFERVSRDGRAWLENVHNDKGQYQLNKTRVIHEAIYKEILRIGGKVHKAT